MENNCCQHCEGFRPPWQDEQGKMRTCRQGCEKWAAHEQAKAEKYEEKKRQVAGAVGISPAREAFRKKIGKDMKRKGGRA